MAFFEELEGKEEKMRRKKWMFNEGEGKALFIFSFEKIEMDGNGNHIKNIFLYVCQFKC